MKLDIRGYSKMLDQCEILVIYNGPIWSSDIDNLAGLVTNHLDEDLSLSMSQAVFSVFVEQINNMMMYSADKKSRVVSDGQVLETSKGIFVLSFHDGSYFIQTGNLVSDSNATILKNRIDYLNTLNKKELRQYYKERMKSENDNPESKGGGLGLIEIARRSSSPIKYELEPCEGGLKYFTTYIVICQKGEE